MRIEAIDDSGPQPTYSYDREGRKDARHPHRAYAQTAGSDHPSAQHSSTSRRLGTPHRPPVSRSHSRTDQHRRTESIGPTLHSSHCSSDVSPTAVPNPPQHAPIQCFNYGGKGHFRGTAHRRGHGLTLLGPMRHVSPSSRPATATPTCNSTYRTSKGTRLC